MKRLPPMNSLRVFEVTARSTSLDEASEELHVTNGAISRHIKQLEDWLGVALFDRSKRSLELTAAGHKYSEKISYALELVAQATQSLYSDNCSNRLGISTTHSIATRLLSDKLQGFYDSHNINVQLSLDQKLNDFSCEEIDIGIRCGNPPWPGLQTLPLLEDRLIPVCHPDLIPQSQLPLSPQELAQFTLLHDDDPNLQWERWFNQHGSGSLQFSNGPRYPSSDVLINAAIYKQGIALVSENLIQPELDSGRLIKANDKSVDLGFYYWLVMPERSLKSKKVQVFCEWLYQELGLPLNSAIFN